MNLENAAVFSAYPGDVMVETTNGLVPMKNLKVGTSVLTPIGPKQVTQWTPRGSLASYTLSVQSPASAPIRGCAGAVIPISKGSLTLDQLRIDGNVMRLKGDPMELLEWIPMLEITTAAWVMSARDQRLVRTFQEPKLSHHCNMWSIEVEEVRCFYGDGYLLGSNT